MLRRTHAAEDRPVTPLAFLAHRGDSAACPENTLAAFAAALSPAVAADGLECDVRLDAAGRPRVFHDDDTARLTGVAGAFAAHTPDALDALTVGGEPIAHLAALAALVTAVAAHRPLIWNVELKPTPAAAALVAATRPLLDPLIAHPTLHLVVSSFDPRVLAAARAAGVRWRLALLYETPLALNALRWLPDPDTFDLHPRHDLVDAAHVAEYARPGRVLRAWTVDEPAEAVRLAALGVAAVVTNRPGPLRTGCDALRQASSTR